jgi:iron complex outermembrane receptor protein
MHIDGNWRDTNDYKIPGNRVLGDPSSTSGRLPDSDTSERSIGAGASYIRDWGYVGLSANHLSNNYGIPSAEGSRIDQRQNRYDLDSLVHAPFDGFETARFKAGFTDYRHAELGEDLAPEVIFSNRSFESRLELTHKPLMSAISASTAPSARRPRTPISRRCRRRAGRTRCRSRIRPRVRPS